MFNEQLPQTTLLRLALPQCYISTCKTRFTVVSFVNTKQLRGCSNAGRLTGAVTWFGKCLDDAGGQFGIGRPQFVINQVDLKMKRQAGELVAMRKEPHKKWCADMSSVIRSARAF